MNYFELYNLPISFHPNQNEVKKQFYALSKKYHPDFYINESAEKQDEVLELATLNNKAFQVLKNPQKVLQYVLALKEMITEGENYTLPQSFLMEMMDVNEAIMDLQFDFDAAKLAQVNNEIRHIEQSLNDNLQLYTKEFENANAAEQQASLAKIKDCYYRSKYIHRLKERLATF